ncbi:4458_t:CDS:2, partial [Scutellospora calospora]
RLSLDSKNEEDDALTTKTSVTTDPDGKTTTTVTTTKTITENVVTTKSYVGENPPSHPTKHTEEENTKSKIAPVRHAEEETTKAKLPPPVKKPEEETVKTKLPPGKPEEKTKEAKHPSPPVKKHEGPDVDEETHHGTRHDPASKCAALVVGGEFKEHLDLIGHDFSKVDAYSRATPESETGSVERLSKYLTSRWNDPLDKLRSIFVWIAENILYDTEALFSGNLKHCTAEETLRKRKSVCDGYSELFSKLAELAGLNVWIIRGKAKGMSYKHGANLDSKEFNHAWNGTVYKGEFLLIDNTWGAGNVNGSKFEKRFEPFYFLVRPTRFIYTHFPNDPKEQYVSPQLTKEEFINLTNVKPPFFAAELEFREHLGNIITTNDDLIDFEIARFHPDEGQPLHAVLEWNGKEVEVLIQRVVGYDPSSGKIFRLQASCPSRGEGKLEIFVMFEGNKGPLAASFKVINKGSGKNHSPFVKTYRVPFKFTLNKPIHLNLKFNKEYKFEFSVFDLKEEKHPEFYLFPPGKDIRKLHKVSRCEDGSFTYELETKVDQNGDWKLVFSSNGKNFDFIAMYHVD